jgi:YD repeat-containing protein
VSISPTEGQQFSGTVATFVDSWDSDSIGHYAATINWGDGNATDGTIAASGSGYKVSGSHTYSEEGHYTLAVTVTDTDPTPPPSTTYTGSASSSITVADASLTNARLQTFQPVEGVTFSGTVASFTDSGGLETGFTGWNSTINWGDTSTSSGSLVAGSGNTFLVGGTHQYREEGSYTVSVSVTDEGGSTATVTGSVTVVDAPLSLTVTPAVAATETQSWSGTVASFADPGRNDGDGRYTVTITWGDNQSGSGTATVVGDHVDITGSHTYAEEGSYTLSVAVADEGGSTLVATGTAAVADLPLTAGTYLYTGAVEGVPLQDATLFLFSDPGGSREDMGDYQLTVDWGGGSGSARVVALSDTSFAVVGSPLYREEGAYTVSATVVDDGTTGHPGSSVRLLGLVTVADAPLSTAPAPAIRPTEGQTFTGTVATFNDTGVNDGEDTYSASINWGDGGTTSGTATVVAGQVQVTGSYVYQEDGQYTVSVTLSDLNGSTISVTGAAVGTATVVDAPLTAGTGLTITSTEAGSFSGPIGSFSDTSGSSEPPGNYQVTINWGDGTTSTGSIAQQAGNISNVNGSHSYAEEGTYGIAITVSDEGGAAVVLSATAVVLDAGLSPAAPPALTTVEGQPFSGTVAIFNDPGIDDGDDRYTAQIDWGDGQTATGTVTIVNGQVVISGSHTYAEEGPYQGLYGLQVNLTDEGGSSVTALGAATVTDLPLVAGTALTVNATEAATFSGTVALFTDPGGQGEDLGDYGITIDWGDGSNTTGGTVVALSDTTFAVLSSHTYSEEGNYTVSVIVVDDGNTTDPGSGLHLSNPGVVADAPLVVSPVGWTSTEGQDVQGTIATFVDLGGPETPGNYLALIDWGDGSPVSTGYVTLGNTPGTLAVLAEHSYGEDGLYTATVTVIDDGNTAMPGYQASIGVPMRVNESPLAAGAAVEVDGTEGQAVDAVVATFTDAAQEPADGYAATIDWGDGSATSSGTVVQLADGTYQVQGNHVYADEGQYTLSVTIVDDPDNDPPATAGTLTVQTPALIVNAPFTVILGAVEPVEGIAFSGTVASFLDPVLPSEPAGDFTAQIDWGDGSSSAGTIVALGSGLFDVLGSHTYDEEGIRVLQVTVTDNPGAAPPLSYTTTTSGTLLVEDAPLSGTGTTLFGTVGVPLADVVVADFSDANPNPDPADFSATISWGDGSSSDNGVIEAGDGGGFVVVGSHTYLQAGDYDILVRIHDVGGSATAVDSWAHIRPLINSLNALVPGNDSQDVFLTPVGEFLVAPGTGGLRATQQLDFDQSPGTSVGGDPVLYYNSDTVSPRPIIQGLLATDASGGLPTQLEATLNWDPGALDASTSQTTFQTTGHAAGDSYLLAMQVPNVVTQTGLYPWEMTVTIDYADGPITVTASGLAAVVVEDQNNPLGAGWAIAGIDHLVNTPYGVLWVTGTGDSRTFLRSGGTLVSPANDFGTLVQNADGSFTYTAKDQTQEDFDATGLLRSVIDTHGLARNYGYDVAGDLTSVQVPDGSSTTLDYVLPGLVVITEPGSRQVRLSLDGNDNLAGLTDAANNSRAFAYDGGPSAHPG